ncbi:MAG: aldolase [Rhizobiales bacterium]|nr:aldolase [Hyphomicrobiales bacterium]
MSGTEDQAREALVGFAKSLFARGFTVGSSGNISVRLKDGFLVTPTNSCFGDLHAEDISKLGADGTHVSGRQPSKEWAMHKAMLDTRPNDNAVVHLHSTYATALSCLDGLDENDCIPPLTPYFIMRVGRAKLLPYFRPGSSEIAAALSALNGQYTGVLLANHGPVVCGASLADAVYAAEEMEEASKIAMLTNRLAVRSLSAEQIDDLIATFGKPFPLKR